MAMPRLFKFLLGLVILFFVVGVLAIFGVWMAMSRGPSIPDHSTLVLRIGGDLVETPPNDVLGQLTGGVRAQTVRGYVEALRRAKTDPRIDSVLIVPTPIQSPYWGKVQEIRDAVIDFRSSGKRVSAYLEYAGEREYYLATAADRIYLVPSSRWTWRDSPRTRSFSRARSTRLARRPTSKRSATTRRHPTSSHKRRSRPRTGR